MRGDTVPSVDPDDFKKVWAVRRALVGGSIDVEIFRRICKPSTDVMAAGYRASLLLLLTQSLPDELTEFVLEGEPSDAFLEMFATAALEEGKPLSLRELLKQIKNPPRKGHGQFRH
jgi:hypothetical protein